MAKVAVTFDNWKKQTFKVRLKEAGFVYEDRGQFSNTVHVFAVETDELERLQAVCERIHYECRRMRAH